MKKAILLLLTLGVLVALPACNRVKKNKTEPSSTASAMPTPVDAAHNSRNSLDYMGTYAGVLPCADCEGISTEITLDKHNYLIKTTYLGKETENIFENEGTYQWNEGGSIITLTGEQQPNQYLVGENVLIKLDMEGKPITGELAPNYRLAKIK